MISLQRVKLYMETSKTLTIPSLILAMSLTFAGPSNVLGSLPSFNYENVEATSQTTLSNKIASYYHHLDSDNIKSEAMALFGIQNNFSCEEQRTYRMVLDQKSQDININIFDLF